MHQCLGLERLKNWMPWDWKRLVKTDAMDFVFFTETRETLAIHNVTIPSKAGSSTAWPGG